MIGNLVGYLRVSVAEMSGFKCQSHYHMVIKRICTHVLISACISPVSSSIKYGSNSNTHENL